MKKRYVILWLFLAVCYSGIVFAANMTFNYDRGVATYDGQPATMTLVISGTVVTGTLNKKGVCESNIRLTDTNLALTGTLTGVWEGNGIINGTWTGGDSICGQQLTITHGYPANGTFTITKQGNTVKLLRTGAPPLPSGFTYNFGETGKIYTGNSDMSNSSTNNSGNCNDILIDIGNIAACDTTQTSVFNLQSEARVNTITVWYNTQIGGLSLPFNLQGPGTQFSGTFQTKSCDPYQSQWCEGQFIVNNTFQPGQYTITTSIPAVCQNSGSGGNGFVKVRGCFTNINPNNPHGNNNNPHGSNCKQGTNPFEEDICVHPR
jgi:hypothetical protein